MRRKCLITGCGRSGTKFISAVFIKAGFDLKHEKVGEFGCSSLFFAVPHAKWMPPPDTMMRTHCDGSLPQHYEFDHIFHQVRHPLKVIPSAVKVYYARIWDWMADHDEKSWGSNKPRTRHFSIARGMRHWLYWNQVAMRRNPELTYRVENIKAEWSGLCKRLGINAALPDVSTTTNHQGGSYYTPEVFTWEKLFGVDWFLTDEIMEQAKQYGYELDGES